MQITTIAQAQAALEAPAIAPAHITAPAQAPAAPEVLATAPAPALAQVAQEAAGAAREVAGAQVLAHIPAQAQVLEVESDELQSRVSSAPQATEEWIRRALHTLGTSTSLFG